MTKKTVFIIIGVLLLGFFLTACRPHHWGPGCELDGFGSKEVRWQGDGREIGMDETPFNVKLDNGIAR